MKMLKIKLAEDVTSFDVETQSLSGESLQQRYLRLKRELEELGGSQDLSGRKRRPAGPGSATSGGD